MLFTEANFFFGRTNGEIVWSRKEKTETNSNKFVQKY